MGTGGLSESLRGSPCSALAYDLLTELAPVDSHVERLNAAGDAAETAKQEQDDQDLAQHGPLLPHG